MINYWKYQDVCYCSWTCWRAEDKRKAARGISTLRGGNYAKW